MGRPDSRRSRRRAAELEEKYLNRPSRSRGRRRIVKPEKKKGKFLAFFANFWWALAATCSSGLLVVYIFIAITFGLAQPFIPTVGVSMNPTIYQGSLAVVRDVLPEDIEIGDIIAVGVTEEAQMTYGVPDKVLHRVVGIDEGNSGLVFTTQGDNPVTNADPDPYRSIERNVIGRVVTVIPHVGWVPLILSGVWGRYLGIAIAFIVFVYWLLGLRERRLAAAAAQESLIRELTAKLESRKRSYRKHSSFGPQVSRSGRAKAGRGGAAGDS